MLPEAVALPLMMLDGDASVPDQTVAAQLCVEIVSPIASCERKSKV